MNVLLEEFSEHSAISFCCGLVPALARGLCFLIVTASTLCIIIQLLIPALV